MADRQLRVTAFCICCCPGCGDICNTCGPLQERPDLFGWDVDGYWAHPGREDDARDYIATLRPPEDYSVWWSDEE